MKSRRIVSMVSGRSKYNRFPYPVIPAFDTELNTYVTGQHVEAGIHELGVGLTVEKMTGKEPLTKAEKERFPFVINPEASYPLQHMMRLDLSTDERGNYVNPRHKALFDLFLLQPIVALNKEKFVKSKHIFYVQDQELEAQVSVKKDEQMFRAIQQVMMDTSLNKFIELAMWLNFAVGEINISVKQVSVVQLQKAIYDACKDHPEQVLQFYQKSTRETMFILKLHYYGIIERRENAYYDGEQYLGRTPTDVIAWGRKKEHEHFWKHWGDLLNQFEGKAESLSTGKKKPVTVE